MSTFYKKIIESKFLCHIFVENLDIINVKMTPIPLGLLYPKIKLDIESPEYCNIDLKKRNIFCLSRHRSRNGGGQWKDRGIVNNLCKTKWSSFVKIIDKEIPKDSFINEIRNSKFCLCIHGGGYDPCPRFFESILYGAIPIIQHSPLDPFLKKYPVVFIKNLKPESLSKKILLKKLQELREFYEGPKRKEVLYLLTMDYWWGLINSKIQE